MQDYVIVTDSTCDLPEEIIKKLNIKVIPYELTFDGENYLNSMEIDYKDFYKQIREGKLPKTTQINSAKFIENFEPILKEDLNILYICFSSALSGTYYSAVNAAKELKETYSNQKVVVVDSLSASIGQGMLVYEACAKKQQGYSIDELEQWLNKNKTRIYHVATVNDLFHLKRGGRISSSAAVFGTMLNIKPTIKMSSQGTLEPFGKVRGRRAAILSLVDNMAANMILDENKTVFIAHADCLDDAQLLMEEIRNKLNINSFILSQVGPIIGSHIGPEALIVSYWAKNR